MSLLLLLLGQSDSVRALAPSSPDKWDCISAASTCQCGQQARYATSCPRFAVHMGGGTCYNLFNEVSTGTSRTPLGSPGVSVGNLFLRRDPASFSPSAGVTSAALSKGRALPSCTSGDALPGSMSLSAI